MIKIAKNVKSGKYFRFMMVLLFIISKTQVVVRPWFVIEAAGSNDGIEEG
jgi:hypothetical protein